MARPRGSRNVTTVQQVEVPTCPNCGSTDAVTLNTNVQEYGGFTADAKEYNRIVKRRTQCKDCLRVWIVRSFEFEPPKPPEETPPSDTSENDLSIAGPP
jgi:NAD-dependent SIR2 family protein deacetylase